MNNKRCQGVFKCIKHEYTINDQYRIIFKFKDKNAHNVEIIDYHK
ncbi:MAG: type II toxin-antitoxin system RelE/ParE family toxin [Deltaproteobacteria bacterium]|nr:type II toxin-antitoxin system RelE/ParE family toxin [Deltaproteobacteria bacterium]MCL5879571.1 type II toxin-antitoxin system RelE/ParE family toxin [Deltaproteobacteria bacterium]